MASPERTNGTNNNKKTEQKLQRQDSGFISGAPTPVTPLNNYDIPPAIAASNLLPPIPESPSSTPLVVAMNHQVNDSPEVEKDQVANEISGIRPSRPTTLSPHAPPPLLLQGNKDEETLTPGTFLRHYNKSGGQLPDSYQEYLQKKANEIVLREVPDTPTTRDLLTSQEPSQETQSHPLLSYPSQTVLHPVNKKWLHPSPDGHYYEYRDYSKMEEDLLGEGTFGQVYACQDRTYMTMFAVKCNKQENKITTMAEECNMLHQIGEHDNITQFLGALEEGCCREGTRFKMLMECAINGNLRELLYDPDDCDGEQSGFGLPLDQSLYYLQQILFAVDYLHQRSILHLDLKCANILVFNEGRTVKLTDFGSSVKLNELSNKSLKIEFTPYFSAPEVICSDSISFSADVWSVMCCLIEMLTGKLPWCYHRSLEHTSVMFLVGGYKEEKDFKELVPYTELQLDDDVVTMFRNVYKKDPIVRPSALELLKDPLIREAHEYEKCFDGYEYDDVATPPPPPIEETPKPVPVVYEQASVDSGRGSDKESPNDASPYSNTEEAKFPNNSHRHRDSGISLEKTLQSLRLEVNQDESHPFEQVQTLTHSFSAPSDSRTGYWDDDVEKDGPQRNGNKTLKRTTSASYVSNGPEADSPDGRLNISGCLPFITVSGTMVSVGTQTNLSPTIESKAQFGSHTVLSSLYHSLR